MCRRRFRAADAAPPAEALAAALRPDDAPAAAEFLSQPFTPGELFAFIEDRAAAPAEPREALLERVLALCEKVDGAEHGMGYWTDHWVYNFDLLASFLAIFPERFRQVVVADNDLTYWDDAVFVLPRDEKYVLYADGRPKHIESVRHDPEKAALIASRADEPNCVRTGAGRGPIYRTNLLEKVVCLLANKVASLSPSGVGIEMDAGRPGWHDSINGLPGLFGSTTSETFHLLRAIRMIRARLEQAGLADDYRQAMPVELADFVRQVHAALRRRLASADGDADHAYWEAASSAREAFRRRVWFGFDGAMEELTWRELRRFLTDAEARIEASLPGAIDPATHLPATYVAHEPVEYEVISEAGSAAGPAGPKRTPRGFPCVRVTRFRPHRLPLFLEAPAHALRIETGVARARRLWQAVRAGPLYDRKLRMYLLGDCVQDESRDLGRIRAWPPGWFENENIFLHMEHKYLLSALTAGLYEEFFEDFRNCLIPFQDPKVYGRNVLENASFIVSSRHPRRTWHGRGFLPRSSGTTAEVLHMMLVMSFGAAPFRFERGELVLRFSPVLPSNLFTRAPATRQVVDWQGRSRAVSFPANSCSALFLGHTMVTYVNPARGDTFGEGAVRPVEHRLFPDAGGRQVVPGCELRGEHALAVRQRRVARIEVALGRRPRC